MLPDVALIEVFDFYMDEDQIEAWHTLVHVCQEWRNLVFGSARRLDLRLLYKAKKSVTEMLEVWPPLPVVVRAEKMSFMNIIAALEHNDRICQLRFKFPYMRTSHWEMILESMRRPFPALTNLQLQLQHLNQTVPVDPDSFLGGSAPRLRTLLLDSVPFPGLPKFLLSATHLVDLDLRGIPHPADIPGYIPLEELLTVLATLTRLEKLSLEFAPPCFDRKRPPPPTRTLLPILTKFKFRGPDEYLENLVACIDTPLLDNLHIIFLRKLTSDSPQLVQLISRTPKFSAQDRARVVSANGDIWVTIPQKFDGRLNLGVSGDYLDWHLWSLTPVCRSSFPQSLILAVEHLFLLGGPLVGSLGYDAWEYMEWLEILRPFIAVKSLYISHLFESNIARSLQELVGERVTEVLPALKTLFFEETFQLAHYDTQSAIGKFVAARQLAGHPITISRWEDVKDVWKDEFGDR